MNFFNATYFGIAVFAVAYVVSRVVNERAGRLLSAGEKARLVDGFSKFRIFTAVVFMLFVFIFIAADNFLPNLFAAIRFVFPIAGILTLICLSVLTFKKLKALAISQSYIKTHLLGLAVQYLGLIFLFALNVLRDMN